MHVPRGKIRKIVNSQNSSLREILDELKGENFNGNEFAEAALNKGALCAVVDDKRFAKHDHCILVEDSLLALQELAMMYRQGLSGTIIGITGSNGKTTTKELIREVLSTTYHTEATTGNLNNHIGVPLTLLSLPVWTGIRHLHGPGLG